VPVPVYVGCFDGFVGHQSPLCPPPSNPPPPPPAPLCASPSPFPPPNGALGSTVAAALEAVVVPGGTGAAGAAGVAGVGLVVPVALWSQTGTLPLGKARKGRRCPLLARPPPAGAVPCTGTVGRTGTWGVPRVPQAGTGTGTG
jgi:hypothetical protein